MAKKEEYEQATEADFELNGTFFVKDHINESLSPLVFKENSGLAIQAGKFAGLAARGLVFKVKGSKSEAKKEGHDAKKASTKKVDQAKASEGEKVDTASQSENEDKGAGAVPAGAVPAGAVPAEGDEQK